MAIGAFSTDAFDAQAFDDAAFLFEDAGVVVPDVVGQSQADATTALEGEGFVVSVQTAYSSVVPAGDVISQVPAGGVEALEGSTVTITVSLGEALAQDELFTGGFVYAFERERARRERERREQLEREEEAQRIEEETTRQIALLLREQEAKDARRAELARLSNLVARFAGRGDTAALGPRVEKALRTAAAKQTAWALFQLERELARAHEEEQFILEALRTFLDG